MTEKIHTGGLRSFEVKGTPKIEPELEKAIEEGYKKAEERKAREKRNRIILIIIILIILLIAGFLLLR